ncbi:tetratricopeptide repeat protein, partial [Nonomuraea sp. NPDC059007]|uniref:tetratricopeptide repeat protein n=1 Tax=Nonomuraea sp. NPDC059007 TaxID=3346692 RepID=UPI00367CBD71
MDEHRAEPESATKRWAAALRALHAAAGAPAPKVIERQAQAQIPSLRVSSSSWNDWTTGKNVPADDRVAAWLIAYLTGQARHHTPSYVPPPASWWKDTRDQAKKERARGGRPATQHPDGQPPKPMAQLQVGRVPQEADCFQEREVAGRVRAAAAEDGTVVLCQVLAGMGGVGKTQLAAAYARRARAEGVKVLVWASASSRPPVIDAYAEAAVKLGLAGPEDPGQAAEAFLVWAETTTVSWLVVLDDLHDPGDLRDLWPPACPAGTSLVTTRRRDAAVTGAGRRLLQVDLYTPAEARSYLQDKLGALAEGQEQVDALAGDLGRLPLALAQAAAYMLDQQIGCARYRRLLAGRLLAHTVPESGGLPDNHQRIVTATWELSIEQADRARPAGLARPLLRLTSVLDPNGIPALVLTSEPARHYLASYLPGPPPAPGDEPEADADMVEEALRVLHRFSLLDHDRGACYREARVHQLIQRATRENLQAGSPEGPELFSALTHTAADALYSAWPAIERDQLAQVLRANTTALATTAGDALWEGGGVGPPVLFRAGSSLGDAGQVAAAISAYTDLHATSQRILGPDHPDTLATRSNLAGYRGAAGDAAGAAAAYEELLADGLRILGPDHPHTLTTRSNLAGYRGEAGDAAGAAA